MDQKDRGAIALVFLVVFFTLLAIIALVTLQRINNDSPQLAENTQKITKTPAAADSLRGFNFVPKSFTSAGYSDFFGKLPKSKSAVTWAGDWQELERSGGGPQTVAELAKKHGFEPIFIVSTYKDGGSFEKVTPLRPVEANTEKYVDSAVAFCEKYLPNYFGIGVETNRIHASSAAEFENFVDLFDQTAVSVHSACPNTKVFSAFQLEHLRGLKGGLYGGIDNEDKNDWQLLEKFPNADFFAFTTYPGIIFKDPAEIPPAYYSSISNHTKKPIAFTEVGWPSQLKVAGWASSEEEQASFARKFNTLTAETKPLFSIWPFLYDQNLPDPFKGIGLLRSDSTPRPSYQIWTNP